MLIFIKMRCKFKNKNEIAISSFMKKKLKKKQVELSKRKIILDFDEEVNFEIR